MKAVLVLVFASQSIDAARVASEDASLEVNMEEETLPKIKVCETYAGKQECVDNGETPVKELRAHWTWHPNAWDWIWGKRSHKVWEVEQCEIHCCADGDRKVTAAGVCRCLHTGEVYSNPKNAEGTDDPGAKYCCSEAGQDASKCACARAGFKLSQKGAKASDCCSGVWNNSVCQARKCTAAGDSPTANVPCCQHETKSLDGEYIRYTTNALIADGKCGCFHAGQKPTINDLFRPTDCCSSQVDAATGRCAIVTDAKTELRPGADAKDCASGKTVEEGGKLFCAAAKCTAQGQKIEGGMVCCSGKDVADVCTCKNAGETVPTGQGAAVCCSGSDTDGTCDFFDAGDLVASNLSIPEANCAGGFAPHGEGKLQCNCVAAGQKLTLNHKGRPGMCCSSKVTAPGGDVCDCAANGHVLNRGGKVADCCSLRENDDVCVCAFPGYPLREGRDGSDCCAKKAINGVCSCHLPGANATRQGNCCAAHTRPGVGVHECTCIPSKVVVADYVTAESCCNKKKEGSACA